MPFQLYGAVYFASELYVISTLRGLRELVGISWNGTRLHPPFAFAERAGAPARACKSPGFRPSAGISCQRRARPRCSIARLPSRPSHATTWLFAGASLRRACRKCKNLCHSAEASVLSQKSAD